MANKDKSLFDSFYDAAQKDSAYRDLGLYGKADSPSDASPPPDGEISYNTQRTSSANDGSTFSLIILLVVIAILIKLFLF